jgi:hypothetical protein
MLSYHSLAVKLPTQIKPKRAGNFAEAGGAVRTTLAHPKAKGRRNEEADPASAGKFAPDMPVRNGEGL